VCSFPSNLLPTIPPLLFGRTDHFCLSSNQSGKTKSGSNSSSSVGSQNGSAPSIPNSLSNSVSNHQAGMLNGSGFNGVHASPQFPTGHGIMQPNMNPSLRAPVGAHVNPMQTMQQLVAAQTQSPGMGQSPLQHVPLASLNAMFPLLSNQQVPQGGNGFSSQAGAPQGRNSASASSSSFSFNSGGNSGGSNSSDTRTQLSSGDSEEEGNGGEGMVCRRTARREYHKKIERKRRDRMRMLYDKLRSLTEASELADKNGVLEGAIALIQELKQQNQDLLARAAMLEGAQCSSSSTGDSAGDSASTNEGDSREGSVASSEERESKRSKTTR